MDKDKQLLEGTLESIGAFFEEAFNSALYVLHPGTPSKSDSKWRSESKDRTKKFSLDSFVNVMKDFADVFSPVTVGALKKETAFLDFLHDAIYLIIMMAPAKNSQTSTSTQVSTDQDFIMPVSGAKVTGKFDLERMHPILHVVRPHLGVDISAPMDAEVLASAAGKVVLIRDESDGNGAGNRVAIQHDDGTQTRYFHLSKFADIQEGDRVEQGQVIGYVGSTGMSTGPHLHFELLVEGKQVDPEAYLGVAHHGPDSVGYDESSVPLVPESIKAIARERALWGTNKVTPDVRQRFNDKKELIYKYFDKYGVPREVAVLTIIESKVQTGLVSSAGAKGPWQFMPQVGPSYGLHTDADYNDWDKATDAAARALRDNYKFLGSKSWPLAVMAYNCGMGTVQRAMKKLNIWGKSVITMEDTWAVWKLLGKEPQSYLLQFFDISRQKVADQNPNNPLFVKVKIGDEVAQ